MILRRQVYLHPGSIGATKDRFSGKLLKGDLLDAHVLLLHVKEYPRKGDFGVFGDIAGFLRADKTKVAFKPGFDSLPGRFSILSKLAKIPSKYGASTETRTRCGVLESVDGPREQSSSLALAFAKKTASFSCFEKEDAPAYVRYASDLLSADSLPKSLQVFLVSQLTIAVAYDKPSIRQFNLASAEKITSEIALANLIGLFRGHNDALHAERLENRLKHMS